MTTAPRRIELVTGSLEQKRRYRLEKAPIDGFPDPYGAVTTALPRYPMLTRGVVDGETSVTMLGDLADLRERAAADGTPVRDIVGDDPVDFADTSAQAYTGKRWIDKERARLTTTVQDDLLASGVSYTAYRTFMDTRTGVLERLRSMPIARSSVLWAHVLTSVVANLVSKGVVVLVALLMGSGPTPASSRGSRSAASSRCSPWRSPGSP
jgi:DNA-binding ferritin-like protein (Dps family)